MIYPEINALAWSFRHGISICTEKCRKCGREVEVNIPVISKDFVGFESDIHECGHAYKISYIKPRSLEFAAVVSEEA